ncbi:peptidoglycan-binding protein [Hyalangium gracile]|uniref:peptidoglycan-binding protein n=1 Tax=Hyalangium gracile TaxID=394092 RepID=UPI001CCD727A|nr:peptidoglycan-binding protein [Hyalangium gracile]
MSNTIIPKLIGFGVNALARSGGDPVKAVQDTVNTVRQATDTFAANVRAQQGGGVPGQSYPGAPAGEPLASTLTDINIGVEGQTQDPVGPENSAPHGVEVVQRFLDRLGYMEMDGRSYGFYGDETRAAVEQFQRDNGLEVTGIVDNATLEMMTHPHPRPGYGMPRTDGHFDPNGTATLQQPLFAEAASFYGEQLGLPTSAAMMRLDGSTVQNFENGSLVMDREGRIRILNEQGTNMFTPPDYAAAQAEAGNHFINQMWGDTDGDGNQNCGYASANMGLSYLGVPGWSLQGVSEADGFASTMSLREAGAKGTADTDYSTPGGIYKALTTQAMQEAGVQVEVWKNEWNGSREADVDKMRLAFMNGDNHTAFVVAGNPDTGWGDEAGMDALYRGNDVFNGGHFVSVVGYNPETDKFLVMDPMANQPIEVSAEDMVKYMGDQNVSTGEVLQITYNPPANSTQQ